VLLAECIESAHGRRHVHAQFPGHALDTADADGDVLCVIGVDTLAGGQLDAEAAADFETLAAKASNALCQVAIEVAKGNIAAVAELSAAYEESGEALAAELDEAAQAEAAGDKLASLKAKQKRAAGDLATLTSGHLVFLATRKTVPAELLQVLKAVMTVIAPHMTAAVAPMDWDSLKAAAAAPQPRANALPVLQTQKMLDAPPPVA